MKVIEAIKLEKSFNIPAGKFLIFPKWKKKKIIKGISFSINKGEFVGFLGPNGSGKTTTIKMLSGILAGEGNIKVLGFKPWEKKNEFLKKIGVMFGNRSNLMFDVPVIESLRLLKDIYEMDNRIFEARVKKLSKMLGMEELLNVPVRKLSFGQRMRAEILAVFLHKPMLVMLDEPTIGLDVIVAEEVRKFLKKINEEEKVTIILTTHNIHDVERLCKRTIIIKEGEIIWDGKTGELRKRLGLYKDIEVEIKEVKSKKKEKELLKKFKLTIKGNYLRGRVRQKDQMKVVKLLLECYKISSLNLKDQTLEELIGMIYRDKNEVF